MSYFPFCLNACFNQQLSLHLIRSLSWNIQKVDICAEIAWNIPEKFHEKWKQICSSLLNLDSFGQKDIFSVSWFKLKLGWPDLPLDPVWGVRGTIIKTSGGGPSQDICIWGGPSPKPLPFLPCGHQSCPIWPSPWPYPQLSDSIFGIGVKLGRTHYKLVEIIIKSFRSCLLSKFLKIFKCQRGLKSIIYGLLWLWTVQSPL